MDVHKPKMKNDIITRTDVLQGAFMFVAFEKAHVVLKGKFYIV